MGYARKDLEKTKKIAKKFVRYQEGAELYSIGLTKFQELAKEAKAVYKIDKVALVNCEIFEKYLETFRIVNTVAHEVRHGYQYERACIGGSRSERHFQTNSERKWNNRKSSKRGNAVCHSGSNEKC